MCFCPIQKTRNHKNNSGRLTAFSLGDSNFFRYRTFPQRRRVTSWRIDVSRVALCNFVRENPCRARPNRLDTNEVCGWMPRAARNAFSRPLFPEIRFRGRIRWSVVSRVLEYQGAVRSRGYLFVERSIFGESTKEEGRHFKLLLVESDIQKCVFAAKVDEMQLTKSDNTFSK